MQRSLVLAVAAAATLFTASAANASRVDWSIGIAVPPVATVVSSRPGYYSEPAYYPAPAYYAPSAYPAYYPPRVDYAPRPRIWLPPPPPLPRLAWFHGHDRWHHDGDRDGRHDGDRDGRHDGPGRADWRR